MIEALTSMSPPGVGDLRRALERAVEEHRLEAGEVPVLLGVSHESTLPGSGLGETVERVTAYRRHGQVGRLQSQ
jgi:hypothetical protein